MLLGADAAQDRRAELLVAATEERALPADDADDERRRLVADQRQQLALAEVGPTRRPARTASTPSSVFGEAEVPHHAARRRARAEARRCAAGRAQSAIGRADGVERGLVRRRDARASRACTRSLSSGTHAAP
mgnify:CR=1 FL=1